MSTVVTIENLLKKCGLHENDLKLEIKRKYFPEISRCLTKWKVLSYKMLEFNEGDVTAIEADNLHEEERRFKFLELLKQRLAFKSTYELLVRNLLEIERAEDALSLCVHLKNSAYHRSEASPISMINGNTSALENQLKTVGFSSRIKFWLSELNQQNIISIQSLEQNEKKSELYRILETKTNSVHEKIALRQLLQVENQAMLSNETLKRVVQCTANCHAMNGILLTKEMGDLLQERSPLICFPDSYKIVTKPQSDIFIKVFSSTIEEKNFKQALRVLGIGLCEAESTPIHGNVLIPWLQNSGGGDEKESYASTNKYQSISGMSVSYSTTHLQLSKEAEDGLGSIIEACKVCNDVYKACIHFFQLFGSHIAIGPLQYGGLVVFTCSSVNFEEKERNSILKLQETILKSSDIKDIDIDPKKYEHIWSAKTLTDTCLNTEILLGLKTAASIEQWGKECIAETNSWNLTDRGKQLVAIWELLALDHHYEKFGSVIDVLKESWEKMTGLEATNDDISRINSQKVVTNTVKSSPTLQKKASNSMHSVVANGNTCPPPVEVFPKECILQEHSPSLCSDLQVANFYEPELGINIVENGSNNLLQLLGLNKRYANKIQLKEAIGINSDLTKISLNGKGCSSLHELPFLVLYKLMSYDVKCRSNLMTPAVLFDSDNNDDGGDDDDGDNSDDDDSDDNEEEEEEEEEEDNKKEEDYIEAEIFEKIKTFNQINPMDCLHALLLCCDDLLRQDLFSRLAECQLSVPFLFPDPIKKTLILPIWAMRSIIKEWTPHGQQQQSHSIVTYPMPIISFIRLGQHKEKGISKSRILNVLISGSDNSPFFHYNCSGGQYPRVFSKGLVDMSWYLPSGKLSDTFDDAKAFLNLHGDAHQYPNQTEILTQISSLCFVVIAKKLNTQDQALLKKINDSPCSLQILSGVKNKLNVPKKGFAKSKFISLKNNDTEISKAVQKIIFAETKEVMSLEEITTSLNDSCVEVDENSEALKLAFDSIQVIKEKITSYNGDLKALKNAMLPLQGPDLWQEWASKNKEFYRQTERKSVDMDLYSMQIRDKKEDIRKKQLQLFDNSPSELMTSFLDVLLQFGECSTNQRNYFLQHLNLFFKEHYRQYMNSKEQKYLQLRAELDEISSESLKEMRKKEFDEVQKEILETTLGIEHLFREIGQIYEAACTDKSRVKYCSELSSMMADLVIDGYPLELMDGDVKHVPLKWIKAVFNDVKKKRNDPKIFVLSVLGIRNSGKSTMLNAVFGLQFKVNTGQCTRGVFMQLIELNFNKQLDSGFNYVLIVDTEGLHSPKEDNMKDYNHDNELATFVIGLANTTLINIMGEVSGNMDNVLQTSVHAFLRMTKVENKRSCQFIHQNTSASTKSSAGHKKFTQNLDRFTKEAAKAENSSSMYECFNDVIGYNDMKDTHNFPALWKGTPPMASVNDEYSEKAQFLKHHIISSISEHDKSSDGFQAFSSFICHFSDLWNALLEEDSVFSFKNTLHVIAYGELVKQYNDCKYTFSIYMREWIQMASNEIIGCSPDNVMDTVRNKQKELQIFVLAKRDELGEKMDSFFEGKYHDIAIHWKSGFEIKLQRLAETMLTEGTSHCKELLKSKEKISKFQMDKDNIRVKIAKKVKNHIERKRIQFDKNLREKKIEPSVLKNLLTRDLFADNKKGKYISSGIDEKNIAKIYNLKKTRGGQLYQSDVNHILINILSVDDVHVILKLSPQTDTVLEEKFESIWRDIMDTIKYTPPSTYKEVAKEVQEALIEHVSHIGQYSVLRNKLDQSPLKEWKNIEPKADTTSSFWKKMYNTLWGKYEFDFKVITANILREATKDLMNITTRKCNFSVILVLELLKKVDDHIKSESSKGDKNMFPMEYKLQLYLNICSKSIQLFENMALKFEDDQNPKKYIEENEKAKFLLWYKSEYKQIEAEESIAYYICDIFENRIKNQIKKELPMIVDEMRDKLPYLKDKGKLKVKILSDLLDQDDFKQTMVYITDIQTCIAEHMKIYTIQFADEKSDIPGFTRLQAVVKNVLEGLIQRINNIIREICTVSKNLKDVSDALVNDKRLHSLLEYNDKDIVGTDIHKKVNLDNLKHIISEQLRQLEIKIQKSFSSVKCIEAMKDWSKQPHEILRDIIGCTAACPFCGEQCDHLDEDHFKTRKIPHATKIHRFDCLAGWRDKDRQVMTTGFCPQRVASDFVFYKSNGEPHPYKKYYEVYEDWSIENTPTSMYALYWKIFIMKYKNELAETYKARPAEIPNHWKGEYSLDKVKKDLESLYEQLA